MSCLRSISRQCHSLSFQIIATVLFMFIFAVFGSVCGRVGHSLEGTILHKRCSRKNFAKFVLMTFVWSTCAFFVVVLWHLSNIVMNLLAHIANGNGKLRSHELVSLSAE